MSFKDTLEGTKVPAALGGWKGMTHRNRHTRIDTQEKQDWDWYMPRAFPEELLQFIEGSLSAYTLLGDMNQG